MFHPGDTLGLYRIERELGRGGMSVVFLAHHQRLDRAVALKVLQPNLQSDAGFVARFLVEARAAARLDHPNIVAVYDAGQIDGVDYIAMEYVEGETLAAILQRVGGSLPLDFAQSVIAQVADALDYAHMAGVVHRDVKPSNILIRPNGHALLTDFGIARAGWSDVSLAGAVLGTPNYMSPEQASGQQVDARSDVYSLGVVAFHMLTGRPPFAGPTPQAVIYAHVYQESPDPRQFNPGLPAYLTIVIRQAMAKNPSQRYATASAFAQALRIPGQDATILASAPPASGPGLGLYIAIGVLLGVAALALVTYFFWGAGPPFPPAPAPTPTDSASQPTPTIVVIGQIQTATPTPTIVLTSTPTSTPILSPILSPTLSPTPSPTPTPTPIPVFGPRLAYVSDRTGQPQIYLIDADGANDVQLTALGYSEHPFWSPDGSLLFFTTDRGDGPGLWSMLPDGSEQTEVFKAAGGRAYSLSPDLRHIAYIGQGDGADIFLDGAPWVTLPGDQPGFLWAPDARSIVFESNDGVKMIYTIAIDSRTPSPITEPTYDSWNPTWERDGQHLAFAATRDGNAGIYVARPDGADIQRLTKLEAWSQAPAWSPSSDSLSFIMAESNTAWGLYTMQTDGAGQVRLNGDAFSGAVATWSPDATRLAFLQNDGDLELAVIFANGAGYVRLTENSANDWHPVWQPQP